MPRPNRPAVSRAVAAARGDGVSRRRSHHAASGTAIAITITAKNQKNSW
jgi:hypothetical protein